MKKIKFKVKITPKKISFWSYFLIIMASISIFSHLSLFLYENFYQAITQSKEILILREKVAIRSINIKKFNDVMEKIKQKTASREIEQINNPF